MKRIKLTIQNLMKSDKRKIENTRLNTTLQKSIYMENTQTNSIITRNKSKSKSPPSQKLSNTRPVSATTAYSRTYLAKSNIIAPYKMIKEKNGFRPNSAVERSNSPPQIAQNSNENMFTLSRNRPCSAGNQPIPSLSQKKLATRVNTEGTTNESNRPKSIIQNPINISNNNNNNNSSFLNNQTNNSVLKTNPKSKFSPYASLIPLKPADFYFVGKNLIKKRIKM